MSCTVPAYVAMASVAGERLRIEGKRLQLEPLEVYSYGSYSRGLCSYGLHSWCVPAHRRETSPTRTARRTRSRLALSAANIRNKTLLSYLR